MRFKVGDIVTHKVYNDKSYRILNVDFNCYAAESITRTSGLLSDLNIDDRYTIIRIPIGDERQFNVHDYGFNDNLKAILEED